MIKQMAADLDAGILDRVRYRDVKAYGILTNRGIQTVQYELLKSGHLKQKGREFISAVNKAA